MIEKSIRILGFKSILLFLLVNVNITMADNLSSNMNIAKLKELGKQKFAQNEYSEAIKIYTELRKISPEDPIFQENNPITLQSIAEPIFFDRYTTLSIRTTTAFLTSLPYIKALADANIIIHCDSLAEILESAFRVVDKYEAIGEYEQALKIANDMRSAYILNDWPNEIYHKNDFNRVFSTPEFTKEAIRTYLDLGSRVRIGRILAKQGKRKEAMKQYQKVLAMIQNEKIIGTLPLQDRQKYKRELEKEVKNRINAIK
jgi:tetratricopeptide (TPR) repeat protein